jgi:hypothetical protein
MYFSTEPSELRQSAEEIEIDEDDPDSRATDEGQRTVEMEADGRDQAPEMAALSALHHGLRGGSLAATARGASHFSEEARSGRSDNVGAGLSDGGD